MISFLNVAINGTDKIWPTGTLNLFPGKVDVIIHPSIDIHEYGENNILQLISETHHIIASTRS